MQYRHTGRSGLKLPVLSLGLWHNFGDTTPFERQRDMLRTAFDLGITHLDLANNYGPPFGSAERNFGRHLKEDFKTHRDELVISTKAGWSMWQGPEQGYSIPLFLGLSTVVAKKSLGFKPYKSGILIPYSWA